MSKVDKAEEKGKIGFWMSTSLVVGNRLNVRLLEFRKQPSYEISRECLM